jgi:two-component system response regulator DegU
MFERPLRGGFMSRENIVTRRCSSDQQRRSRVVLADGHLGLLAGVHRLLAGMFESVLMVADEASLLDAVATHHPDLAVVDLSLPRDGEVNVVRRLIAAHPDVNVLVLSVHDDRTVAAQLVDAGAKGFVLKRALAADLTTAVEKVLCGGTFVSPSIESVPKTGPGL